MFYEQSNNIILHGVGYIHCIFESFSIGQFPAIQLFILKNNFSTRFLNILLIQIKNVYYLIPWMLSAVLDDW